MKVLVVICAVLSSFQLSDARSQIGFMISSVLSEYEFRVFETINAGCMNMTSILKRRSCSFDSLTTVVLNRLKPLAAQNADGALELYKEMFSAESLSKQLMSHAELINMRDHFIDAFKAELSIPAKAFFVGEEAAISERCLRIHAEILIPGLKDGIKRLVASTESEVQKFDDHLDTLSSKVIEAAKEEKSAIKKQCRGDGSCMFQHVNISNH